MRESKGKLRLRTTHFPDDKKAHFIGSPMIINGHRSLAYTNGNGDVESYIPWEEAQEMFFKYELPTMTLDF